MTTEAAPSPEVREPYKPPPWRDVRVLRVIGQIVFLVLLFLVVRYLAGNLSANASRLGLRLNFDWLQGPAGIDIRDSDFRPGQSVSIALRVGLINTLRVATVGVALATILGVLIGIGRLSTNWLVRKTAAVYVETLRNIPVLAWILFLYFAIVVKFPAITTAGEYFDAFVFSNRGLWIPWADGGTTAGAFLGALGLGLGVAALVAVWRTKRFDATGQPHHRALVGFLVLLGTAVVAYAVLTAVGDRPFLLSLPEREGRLVDGGFKLGGEYAALLIALVIYTASHIAEIVRGSIQAVPKGQTEAANAIALSGFQRLRYVILPQAFRIAVPPMANQYLNLTKNSSLALFVGYQDLFSLANTFINNGSPAPPVYLVVMATYLFLSLTISLFANIINRSLALEGR